MSHYPNINNFFNHSFQESKLAFPVISVKNLIGRNLTFDIKILKENSEGIGSLRYNLTKILLQGSNSISFLSKSFSSVYLIQFFTSPHVHHSENIFLTKTAVSLFTDLGQ